MSKILGRKIKDAEKISIYIYVYCKNCGAEAYGTHNTTLRFDKKEKAIINKTDAYQKMIAEENKIFPKDDYYCDYICPICGKKSHFNNPYNTGYFLERYSDEDYVALELKENEKVFLSDLEKKYEVECWGSNEYVVKVSFEDWDGVFAVLRRRRWVEIEDEVRNLVANIEEDYLSDLEMSDIQVDLQKSKEIKADYEKLTEYIKTLIDIESDIYISESYLRQIYRNKPEIDRTQNQGKNTEELKKLFYKELTEAETIFKKLLYARYELFEYDVVFSKYRNVVALCSFYEYLISGRCNTLEGHEGAYNIYENERRQDLIISKLSDVLVSLDQIKDNQMTLYSQMKKANRNLSKMNEQLDTLIKSAQQMEDRLDIIENNTAAAAYFSKVNAELTNALGYLVAFK